MSSLNRVSLSTFKDGPRLQKLYARFVEEFDNRRQTNVEWEELALIITRDILLEQGQVQVKAIPVQEL